MIRIAAAVMVWGAAFVGSAFAQPVSVIGPITPGNCPKFSSTTVLTDSGGPCAGNILASNNTWTGTNTFVNPAFLPFLPAILWGQSFVQIGNVYSNTNQAALNINQAVPSFGGLLPSYEAIALFVSTRTSDPGGANVADTVATDFRASIASGNTNGFIRAGFRQATVEAGADGLAITDEISVQNFGTVVSAVNSPKAKYNVSLSSEGNALTAGIMFQNVGPGWANGIWMDPALLTGTAGTYFINLAGKWSVTKAGFTDIGGSGLTGQPLGIQAEAAGGLAIGMRGRAADGISCVQWLSNDTLTTYAQLCSDSTPELVTSTQIVPGTNGTIDSAKSASAWRAVYSRSLALNGTTSGALTISTAAVAGANALKFPAGSTDFTATGGTSQVVKQTSVGGAFTVATIAASEIVSGAALTKADDTNVTLTLGGSPTVALLAATSITVGWTGTLANARLATMATNTVKGNATSGTASPSDLAVGTCSTAASALNWTTNTGFGCNTSITAATLSAALSMSLGGTNANLTASNGGIFYSTASAGAVLSGTATARQMLQSGASAAPAWSTTTWPATTTINRLLYSSAANVISDLATGNNSILVTDSGGTPSLSTTLPAYTLGGAISGGGNQINNVIIGTATPLAGTFTTLQTNTSASVGTGTGTPTVTVNGANSGTGGGAFISVQNAGSGVMAIGNTSAILGGAYSSVGLLYNGANNIIIVAGGANVSQFFTDQTMGTVLLAAATANTLCYSTTAHTGYNVLSTCSSLRELKDDLGPIRNAKGLVRALDPRIYWSKPSRAVEYGLYADDVEREVPLLATYYEGKLNGVDYMHLTAVLAAAVKELQHEIDELRARVR